MKKLDISEDLDFTLEEIIGKCIGILGIRGSGKSNTAGVIFEELLNYNYPLTVVDIDGEYFGLKEQYEILVIGQGENVDINIDPLDAEQVAEVSIKQSIPVVLDLSGYLKEDQREMLKGYFTRLWNLAGKLRKPYMIGIEESHEYIPQGKKGELKEIITRIALRGRKRGLGAVVISQRSAKVEKDVLTQAGMLFLHRVVHEADMKVYNELLPWPKSQVRETVGLLETGDCIFLNEKSANKIYVRERDTFHAGFTPSLDTVETPQLKQVGESILEAIEDAKQKGRRKKSEVERLEERVEELESDLEEKEQKVEELQSTARTLGYIQIDLDQPEMPKVHRVSKAIIESLEIQNVIKEGKSEIAEETVAQALSSGSTGSNTTGESTDTDSVAPGGESSSEKVDNGEGSKVKPKIDHLSWGEEQASSKMGNSLSSAAEQRDEGSSIDRDLSKFHALPEPVHKDVRKIVRRVEHLQPLKQELNAFLINHRPHSYSVEQISAWMDVPPGLILSNRPYELIDCGLIQREGRVKGIHYRSRLKRFVEQQFTIYEPDIQAPERHYIIKYLEKQLVELGKEKSPVDTSSSEYVKIDANHPPKEGSTASVVGNAAKFNS
ncbi:MAG: ATP-binding protein [Candidatus Acetothermia bacterium]